MKAFEDRVHILLLFFRLPFAAQIRGIPADIGLSAFILEIDLRLIERRMEQVIGMMLHAGSGRRTDAEPIEPQGIATGDPVLRIERQEIPRALPSARDRDVALIFRDDQSEARDLGRKVRSSMPRKLVSGISVRGPPRRGGD